MHKDTVTAFPIYYLDSRDPGTTEVRQMGVSRESFRADIDPVEVFLNMVQNCEPPSLGQPGTHQPMYEKYKAMICKDFDLDPIKY